MKIYFTPSLTYAIVWVLSMAAPTALAHVTLEQPQAPAGSIYKAVFKVGHACEGATATTAITVRLPAGFQGSKPMPKPGWAVSIKRAPLAVPYDNHGRKVTEDVTEIRWQASTLDVALLSDFYDEFTLRGSLPSAPGPLWFKVLQTCDVGAVDWAEVPTSGKSTQGLKTPAALLDVTPLGAGREVHKH